MSHHHFPGHRLLRVAYLAVMTFLTAVAVAMVVISVGHITQHSWIVGAGAALIAAIAVRLMPGTRAGYHNLVADLSTDLDREGSPE